MCYLSFFFFFFNDTATTEIYTLSLHDALPICGARSAQARDQRLVGQHPPLVAPLGEGAAEFLRVPALPRRQDRDAHGGQLVLTPISTVNPPVANAGMSPATALNPGVARPLSIASFELHRRSASR